METQHNEQQQQQRPRKSGSRKPIVLTTPDGTEFDYDSGSQAARTHEGISQNEISIMARTGVSIKGFKVKFK